LADVDDELGGQLPAGERRLVAGVTAASSAAVRLAVRLRMPAPWNPTAADPGLLPGFNKSAAIQPPTVSNTQPTTSTPITREVDRWRTRPAAIVAATQRHTTHHCQSERQAGSSP
jgi:hypothetical protein